jgi:hypothetical protein
VSLTPAIRASIMRALGTPASATDHAAHAAAETVMSVIAACDRLQAGKQTAAKVGNDVAIAYMEELQRQLIVSTPFIVQASVLNALVCLDPPDAVPVVRPADAGLDFSPLGAGPTGNTGQPGPLSTLITE